MALGKSPDGPSRCRRCFGADRWGRVRASTKGAHPDGVSGCINDAGLTYPRRTGQKAPSHRPNQAPGGPLRCGFRGLRLHLFMKSSGRFCGGAEEFSDAAGHEVQKGSPRDAVASQPIVDRAGREHFADQIGSAAQPELLGGSGRSRGRLRSFRASAAARRSGGGRV